MSFPESNNLDDSTEPAYESDVAEEEDDGVLPKALSSRTKSSTRKGKEKEKQVTVEDESDENEAKLSREPNASIGVSVAETDLIKVPTRTWRANQRRAGNRRAPHSTT